MKLVITRRAEKDLAGIDKPTAMRYASNKDGKRIEVNKCYIAHFDL